MYICILWRAGYANLRIIRVNQDSELAYRSVETRIAKAGTKSSKLKVRNIYVNHQKEFLRGCEAKHDIIP